MSIKDLIGREVRAIQQRIRGRVIGDPKVLEFDSAGAKFPLFAAPGVDIGGFCTENHPSSRVRKIQCGRAQIEFRIETSANRSREKTKQPELILR